MKVEIEEKTGRLTLEFDNTEEDNALMESLNDMCKKYKMTQEQVINKILSEYIEMAEKEEKYKNLENLSNDLDKEISNTKSMKMNPGEGILFDL